MGTNECTQPASKSSWDSKDFSNVNMVLKMAHFHKSSRLQWVNSLNSLNVHEMLYIKLLWSSLWLKGRDLSNLLIHLYDSKLLIGTYIYKSALQI